MLYTTGSKLLPVFTGMATDRTKTRNEERKRTQWTKGTKGNLDSTPVNNFSAYSPFFLILQFPVRAIHSLFIVMPS